MWDVGDTIGLRYLVTDDSGEPVDPDTATLTVRLPDGTTATPAVTLPPASTGSLLVDYEIAQHGRHVVLWRTTGPTTAYADVFNAVSPDWPAIVGLDATKRQLSIDRDNTIHDEDLRGFILSASMIVEDVVGVVARRTITETASGGGRHIVLERSPVIEVAEVRVDGILVDVGDYAASPSGLLTRRAGTWPAGLRNVEITYLAGRSAVAPNVLNATLELIRINWRPRQGGNAGVFDGGRGDEFQAGAGEVRLGFFVPNTVMQRLAPNSRPPVVM